ncbi:Protein of unknown function [Pyronema omphalodes CBS 100304]|uniref:SKP1 component POZ domain-containing protein n=1 Tax=Pyronema omphalodes (strain CBS 100304) TaxID=1076935 RepID=U4LJI9_PYROM|nr:Protein of unknown function [Pyronema omphalodes CBS 100304]
MKIPAGIDPTREFYVDYKPGGRMVFIQPKPKKVPEQKYKVRSHDGQCFKISWTALSYSPFLLDMLDDAERDNIHPEDIILDVDCPSDVLKKVLQWCIYHKHDITEIQPWDMWGKDPLLMDFSISL